MTMAEVTDGGLELKIDAPSPTVSFDGQNIDEIYTYKEYMEESYSDAADNFTAIAESLKNALEGQERFFLPVSLLTTR
jgi:hypothetical protein